MQRSFLFFVFIFYFLYSFSFSPRGRFVFQTEISGKYIVLLLISRLFYFLFLSSSWGSVYRFLYGLSSYRPGGKMRDPGNQVATVTKLLVKQYQTKWKRKEAEILSNGAAAAFLLSFYQQRLDDQPEYIECNKNYKILPCCKSLLSHFFPREAIILNSLK